MLPSTRPVSLKFNNADSKKLNVTFYSSSVAYALKSDQSTNGPCEEVTDTVGFDLFRLKKRNKRNFSDSA